MHYGTCGIYCSFISAPSYYEEKSKIDADNFVVSSTTDGDFTISYGDVVWFTSANSFVRKDGIKFIQHDSLKFITSVFSSGEDEIGSYTSNTYRYTYGENVLDYSIRQYNGDDSPVIIFSQV